MRRNDNAVGYCKCDQFYQVKVVTERDDDCAVSLQISCRPHLRPVETRSSATAESQLHVFLGSLNDRALH